MSAVVITRSTPGPVGRYVVSVEYFVSGLPGAVAGWLAMITPAVLVIPLVHFIGRKLENPRVKAVMQTVVLASAGLLLAATIPLARDALTGPVTIAIGVVTIVLMLVTKLDNAVKEAQRLGGILASHERLIEQMAVRRMRRFTPCDRKINYPQDFPEKPRTYQPFPAEL